MPTRERGAEFVIGKEPEFDEPAVCETTPSKNKNNCIFADLPVQAIDLGFVMKVIEPIWATKTETASRLRGRIENILEMGLHNDQG